MWQTHLQMKCARSADNIVGICVSRGTRRETSTSPSSHHRDVISCCSLYSKHTTYHIPHTSYPIPHKDYKQCGLEPQYPFLINSTTMLNLFVWEAKQPHICHKQHLPFHKPTISALSHLSKYTTPINLPYRRSIVIKKLSVCLAKLLQLLIPILFALLYWSESTKTFN